MSDLIVTNEEAQVLLDSAMTTEEKQQRDSSELAIQVAGMEIHERRIVIGKHLLEIYNDRLFRGDEGGQTWEEYLAKVSPKLDPKGEGFKVLTAKRLICLGLVSTLVFNPEHQLGVSAAHELISLLPRANDNNNRWNPYVLPAKEPDHQNFEVVRWALEEAYSIAEKSNRKDGKPSIADVKEAVRLATKGLDVKRKQPDALAKSTAERMAASKVVDVPVVDSADTAAFRAKIAAGAPERERLAQIAETKEALERPRKEEAAAVANDVKRYFSLITDAAQAVDQLESFMQSIDRRHGTKYLDSLRENPTGMLTVEDDVQRIQEIGKKLMHIMEMTQSLTEPDPAFDFETINV